MSKCKGKKCPPPKRIFLKPALSYSQTYPNLLVKTGKTKFNGQDVSNKTKTVHTHSYQVNQKIYFSISANGGEVFTRNNFTSVVLSSSQLDTVFGYFQDNPTMNNITGYEFDVQSVLLYIVTQGFDATVENLNIYSKFTYQKITSKNKAFSISKPNVDDNYNVGQTLETVFIDDTYWLPMNGQTVNVEDRPLLWINANYYDTFKGNTFDIPSTNQTYQRAGRNEDYELISFIDLNGESLTTDFTKVLMSKFENIEELYLYNNDISKIYVNALNNATTIWIHLNNISGMIDFSNSPNLEDLNIRNNNIQGLNLTANLLIQTLSFQNNDVSEIDLTNNTALTQCQGFGNELTRIDLSNNTALTLLYLFNNDFSIEGIDISSNILLESLYLQNCGLQDLDISSNANLINLRTQDNLFDGGLNSDLLTHLDDFGNESGYFQSSIFDGSSLTSAGVDSKNSLTGKLWTIVGL